MDTNIKPHLSIAPNIAHLTSRHISPLIIFQDLAHLGTLNWVFGSTLVVPNFFKLKISTVMSCSPRGRRTRTRRSKVKTVNTTNFHSLLAFIYRESSSSLSPLAMLHSSVQLHRLPPHRNITYFVVSLDGRLGFSFHD